MLGRDSAPKLQRPESSVTDPKIAWSNCIKVTAAGLLIFFRANNSDDLSMVR